MDASRTLNNRRGVALVYLALVLAGLLVFSALVVDLSYMFVAKAQLKNAADAGALAGVFRVMTSPSILDTTQTDARLLAKSYAYKNTAAAKLVNIASDDSNSLSKGNDITVGHWDTIKNTYLAGQTPVNAIEVRARRSTNSPDGNVTSFFAKLFNVNSIDIEMPDTSVAAVPARATGFIALGRYACDNPIPPGPERILDLSVSVDNSGEHKNYDKAIAWSSLFDSNTYTGNVEKLICSETPAVEVCKADDHLYIPSRDDIYMTNASNADLVRSLATAMYNPTFDSAYKDCAGVLKCSAGNRVTGWELILPVVDADNPSQQPDPVRVIKYAKIHVKAVCAEGAGADGCKTYAIQGPSNDGQTGNNAPCKGYPNNSVVIDRLECVTCDQRNNLKGLRPTLVK